MELANEATFTVLELDAYRKVMDEIQQAREYGDAQRAKGKAEALLAVLAARGIAVDEETRTRIAACTDGRTLDRWIALASNAATIQDVVASVSDPERPP